MNDRLIELAGILIAVVLAVDCLLHVYWATGRIWPAQDQLTLCQAVLNSNKTRLFKPVVLCSACLFAISRRVARTGTGSTFGCAWTAHP